MSAATTRPVIPGQTWTRADPTGRTVRFVATKIDALNRFGQMAVRGRTPSGKLIWCDPIAMASAADERFKLLQDVSAQKAVG